MKTDRSARPLRLLPPPGPLCWLFPRLLGLHPPGRADVPAAGPDPGEDRLDLWHTALSGHALRNAILERSPREVRVEDGPRGHATWAWLRQALRGDGIPILPPDVRPPAPEPGDGRGRPGPETFESFLGACARRAGRDGLALAERHEGRLQVRKISFSPPTAQTPPVGTSPGEEHFRLLPVRTGSGLEARLDRALERIAAEPADHRRAGIIPFFLTAPPSNGRGSDAPGNGPPVETRLPLSTWGLLPGDAYPAAVRDRWRELIRALCPERYFLFLALENYALAGIDLYSEALAGRFVDEPARGDVDRPGRGHRPLILAVCGTDGSGKSSHVNALVDHLSGLGLRVERRKIYRHGVFHDTVTDLTRRCAGGRNLHLWRLQRLTKVFDSVKYYCTHVAPALGSCDVLIFDRYLPTHIAAGAGRFHHDPYARELLRLLPPADRTYLLDVPPSEALRRIGARGDRTVDENAYMLSRYRHALGDLADDPGFLVLDGLRPFEENRRHVLEDAVGIARSRGILR